MWITLGREVSVVHNFMRAIGFSEIKNRKELEIILKDVALRYDEKKVVSESEEYVFAEMCKEYIPNGGIMICGEYDEEDKFHREYYFPYFRGSSVSSKEDVIIERHASRDSYSGACDDPRMGVTIIFYLQNTAQFKKQLLHLKKDVTHHKASTLFSGLSLDGKILLPILKDKKYKQEKKNVSEIRNKLINAARNGDTEAMENLTLEDLDTYSMITHRLEKEDVLSIVDSYFMPYGLECDQYSIMGDILEVHEVQNPLTLEHLYELYLECNDMRLDICINEKDLMGKPEVGRRFKGNVWLQGFMEFEEESV